MRASVLGKAKLVNQRPHHRKVLIQPMTVGMRRTHEHKIADRSAAENFLHAPAMMLIKHQMSEDVSDTRLWAAHIRLWISLHEGSIIA